MILTALQALIVTGAIAVGPTTSDMWKSLDNDNYRAMLVSENGDDLIFRLVSGRAHVILNVHRGDGLLATYYDFDNKLHRVEAKDTAGLYKVGLKAVTDLKARID